MKNYVTIKEIKKNLSVSIRTIYTLMENKGLPHIRIGGSLRFSEEDVQAWVDEHNSNLEQKKRA